MKPEKAIKNLIAGREDCGMIPEDEYTQTIDLATEALKYINGLKHQKRIGINPVTIVAPLLPGETED